MLIQLIFSSALTAIVAFTSLKVWKAEFTKKQKIQLVSLLFGLLALVFIANEAKKHRIITFSLLGLTEGDCSDNFYNLPAEQSQPKFSRLPICHKYILEQIKNNLGQDSLMPQDISSSFLTLLISEENQGAGEALHYYAENLLANSIPVFYIKLNQEVKNENDLKIVLKTQYPDKFSDTIRWFNQIKGITPFIIVDHAHLAFNTENEDSQSLLLNLLAQGYLQYDAKIILHTHNHKTPSLFMRIPRIQQLASVIKYKPLEVEQIFEYVSHNLKDQFPKLQKEQLRQLDNSLGLDYEIISKLIQYQNKGSPQIDTAKIIENELKEYKVKVDSDSELYNLLSEVNGILSLNEQVSNTHKIAKLSDIKKRSISNLGSTLTRLEDSGILWIEEGYLSFDKRFFNSMFV